MDITKPLKRRMKIKREGGAWSWVNFKYERLSTFCFVCGILGHSERDCVVTYANPDKVIDKAYGVWLRAPMGNMKNQNIGSRWLRNGDDMSQGWTSRGDKIKGTDDGHGGVTEATRFIEVDGRVGEIPGAEGGIRYVSRDLGSKVGDRDTLNTEEIAQGGNKSEDDMIILDSKRKRVDMTTVLEENGPAIQSDKDKTSGPENELKAGPVLQARLDK
ncbi:hypothetical protein AgCh_014346 [Apium graveolens]